MISATEVGQGLLENGVGESVAEGLLNPRLTLGRPESLHPLPLRAVASQLVVVVLHPHHRHVGVAGLHHQVGDGRDDVVAVVGACDDTLL